MTDKQTHLKVLLQQLCATAYKLIEVLDDGEGIGYVPNCEYLKVKELAKRLKIPATEVVRRLYRAGLVIYAHNNKYYVTDIGRPYVQVDTARNLMPRWSTEVIPLLDEVA